MSILALLSYYFYNNNFIIIIIIGLAWHLIFCVVVGCCQHLIKYWIVGALLILFSIMLELHTFPIVTLGNVHTLDIQQ